MAMTYSTLVDPSADTPGSICYFVRHTKVPSAYILERAQEAIYSVLRVREMLTQYDGTIASGDDTIPFPTDCKHPLQLWLTGADKNRLEILDYEQFEQLVGEDSDGNRYEGTPTFATFDKKSFHLDVRASRAFNYRIWYMARLANLAATTNEANILTTTYGHILEAMCKHYAYAHREQDDQAQNWLTKASAFIATANQEYDEWWQQIRANAYWSK